VTDSVSLHILASIQ